MTTGLATGTCSYCLHEITRVNGVWLASGHADVNAFCSKSPTHFHSTAAA